MTNFNTGFSQTFRLIHNFKDGLSLQYLSVKPITVTPILFGRIERGISLPQHLFMVFGVGKTGTNTEGHAQGCTAGCSDYLTADYSQQTLTDMFDLAPVCITDHDQEFVPPPA